MLLTPLAGSYDHLLLDLDGCVWVGDEPTARAVEAISALRHAGKGIAFVTNDGRWAAEEHVRKLWRLGFQASVEEVVTVGGALQFHLAERYGRDRAAAVVVGSPAIHRHVEQAGLRIVNRTAFASRAEVVVVGAHDGFDYAELREATQAALRGAVVVAAGRDAHFPMPDGPWPGTGAVVAAIEAASGVVAENVGKPEAAMVQAALDRLGPGRALFVGDRIDSDLGVAANAGIDGALVLTGATTPLAGHRAEGAIAVRDSLADLVLA
jgi:HAD superfamily hydrolase (TIGR01450 family)